jgi:hypothetical protein
MLWLLFAFGQGQSLTTWIIHFSDVLKNVAQIRPINPFSYFIFSPLPQTDR